MNQKIKLILLCSGFAVLIGGSWILYSVLTKNYNSLPENNVESSGISSFSEDSSSKNSHESGVSELLSFDSSSELFNSEESSETVGESHTAPQNEASESVSHASPSSGSTSSKVSSSSTAVVSENSSEAQSSSPYNKADNFTVYDSSGNSVSLSDYIGTPVVVNFWASWCGPCLGELPVFQEAYNAYGSEVKFLMVNLTGFENSAADAQNVINNNGYSFPVYYDTDNSAVYKYNTNYIPDTAFINRSGELVYYHVGGINSSTLTNYIGEILE